jgi:serine/threonine protein kinase
MTRASALDAASGPIAIMDPTGQTAFSEDRRVSDSNQAWLGKIVDGRYRVLEVIGRGGMGVVYRVEHLRMGKVAAMKVLHRDLADDADIVHRFEREAAAVSRLHHPHTVQVFDFGTAGGALYLIMEYVRGQDLGRIVDRDGPMPWARAAARFAQICGSLQESHDYGIIHRDLKPENVLITRSTAGRDYAKVLDFGLAKLDQRNVPKRETERSQIVGTPYFMSPEQIRGEEVDARSDIYSFGALMFQVLTGQHLYSGTTAVGVLTKHLTAEPDAPSMRTPKMGIPPSVDHLVRKALARDPAKRWQTAQQLGEAIEEIYLETVADATGPKTVSKKLGGGTLVFDTHDDAGSDVRLRRSDIDAYEASIKRRRVWVWLSMVLLAAGGAAAIGWLLLRPPGVTREEREPNNSIESANLIGRNVRGFIGKRVSPNEGDKDYFRFGGSGRRVVSVMVTGIPNVDINLSVDDTSGHSTSLDEGRIGEGEALHRRMIDGPVIVGIGQTLAKDQKFPTENVSDAYELTVVEERADAGEIEPNNMEADATPLEPTYELRGYLDTKTDVDLLRWTGETGTYIVVVRADGVPLQWKLGDGVARTPGEATIELKKGELIRIERNPAQPQTKPDVSWSIVVVGSGRAK